MKNLFLFVSLLWLLAVSKAGAVCNTPISRTNNGTNAVLTSTKYNTDLNTVYTRTNNLPGDCIVDASVDGDKLIDASVGTTKLEDASITTAKVADGAITAAKLAAAIENLVPVGTILPFGGTVAPSGYLLGQGQSLSRVTYATLFGVIGTANGALDGNSFSLPDCRGRFMRFTDGGAGRDPDRASRTAAATGGNSGDAVGSIQGSMYASHNHHSGSPWTATGSLFGYISSTPISSWTGTASNSTYYMYTSSSGGNETRPINFNVNCIIKY